MVVVVETGKLTGRTRERRAENRSKKKIKIHAKKKKKEWKINPVRDGKLLF